jgi:hypothetical protein
VSNRAQAEVSQEICSLPPPAPRQPRISFHAPSPTPPPRPRPTLVALSASSTRSFFSPTSTSLAPPIFSTATPPLSLARRSWNLSLWGGARDKVVPGAGEGRRLVKRVAGRSSRSCPPPRSSFFRLRKAPVPPPLQRAPAGGPPVVVARRRVQRGADLVAARLDGGLVAGAVQQDGVVLGDGHLRGWGGVAGVLSGWLQRVWKSTRQEPPEAGPATGPIGPPLLAPGPPQRPTAPHPQ